MDIDSFIAKYRPGWERLDAAVKHGPRKLARSHHQDLPDLVSLYLLASAHLAEVQTTYRDPSLESYLNGLVARAHAAIYGSQARSGRDVVRFFAQRYREALHRTVPHILVIAAIFTGVTVALMLWVANSREAQAGLLPGFAREMVRDATGNRAVSDPPTSLATEILFNNVQVGFLAFALGITLGIGTIYVVVQNAVLIGTLAGAFTLGGKAGVFWALIVPHGALEIIAICIAGGAGLRIGWSLVDPRDRPRQQALVEETRDAVLVVLGVIPAFLVAAAIEGYITGQAGVPRWFQITLGVVIALAYVVFLFGGRAPALADEPATDGRTP